MTARCDFELQPAPRRHYALPSRPAGTNPAATRGDHGRIPTCSTGQDLLRSRQRRRSPSLPSPRKHRPAATIELGAAVSATGIYAANGKNTKNGYEFALKKINDAGGVTIGGKCYHFKIKYYDDESTPARAAQLVERLIDQDKIQLRARPLRLAADQGDPAGDREVQDPAGAGRSGLALAVHARLQISLRHRRDVGEISRRRSSTWRPRSPSRPARIRRSVKIAMIYQDDAFSLDVRARRGRCR